MSIGFSLLLLFACSPYPGAQFEDALRCGTTIEEAEALAQKRGGIFLPPSADDPISQAVFESSIHGETVFFLYFGDDELGMLLARRAHERRVEEVFCCPEIINYCSTPDK